MEILSGVLKSAQQMNFRTEVEAKYYNSFL